jgi:hypothetical protein
VRRRTPRGRALRRRWVVGGRVVTGGRCRPTRSWSPDGGRAAQAPSRLAGRLAAGGELDEIRIVGAGSRPIRPATSSSAGRRTATPGRFVAGALRAPRTEARSAPR